MQIVAAIMWGKIACSKSRPGMAVKSVCACAFMSLQCLSSVLGGVPSIANIAWHLLLIPYMLQYLHPCICHACARSVACAYCLDCLECLGGILEPHRVLVSLLVHWSRGCFVFCWCPMKRRMLYPIHLCMWPCMFKPSPVRSLCDKILCKRFAMSSNEEAKKPGTPRSRERSRSPVRGSGRDPVSDVAMLPDPDPELARQLVAEQLGVRIAKLIIQVPPDGRCLYHCFTAWQFGPAWLRHRDAAGFSTQRREAKAYTRLAKDLKKRLIRFLYMIGNKAQALRLKQPGSAGYPGSDELQYLAELQSCTVIEHDLMHSLQPAFQHRRWRR